MVDLSSWSCPLPLRNYPRVVMGHGGGGQLSAELVEHLFLPSFEQQPSFEHRPETDRAELVDAAQVDLASCRLAFSTDSYVVRPLFFPGGCIGDLAVNGTVNDVAMRGANAVALSAGFILEEGLELDVLGRVVQAMGAAARLAGVPIRTGDTKVVEAGKADGLYITTAGFGVIPEGVDIRPSRAAPGDVVIVSGPLGAHGIAVMSQREGLEFGTALRTDSAPLNGLVAAMIATGADLHVLRDPTRGGAATSLCEIAATAAVGISYEESLLPIPTEVEAACAFLGLDPMHVANEGRLLAIVAPTDTDVVMNAMLSHEHGKDARVIGRVTAEHPGLVVAKTPFGATRVVAVPIGEQLPRIC